MFFKRKRIKKQEALFTEALFETDSRIETAKIRIDHASGECFYKENVYSIIFPIRFLRESRALDYEKKHDFSFRGLYTDRREWVKSFHSVNSKISFTENGRKLPKDHFDVSYYQELAHTRFTLCPAGDFQWTYRFLEALMCRSIPVVEAGCSHPHFHGFTYFFSDQDHRHLLSRWDENIVNKNYSLFLKRNTLIDQFIFLPENGA